MTDRDKPIEKVYYSIKEVAQMIHVNNSTLRFWEDQFEWISPMRDRNGKRRYKDEDVRQIMTLNILLNLAGMTLAGVSAAHAMSYLEDLKKFIMEKFRNYEGLKPMNFRERPATMDEAYPPPN